MSHLIAMIDAYKDAHGQPSDASIARAVGVSPQALSAWRKRGFRDTPAPDTLRRLAELIGVPYEEYLLQAVLVDAGFRTDMPTLEQARSRVAERMRSERSEAG